jgi:hypothetical protein
MHAMKRALILAILVVAPAAFAQTMEYGRGDSGMLDMTTKQPKQFFGSLSLNSALGFGGSVSGTAVKDHVWFFAAADRSNELFRATAPMTKSDITAAFVTARPTTMAFQPAFTLPKDFLSLHTTSVLSPNSFVTFDVSQTRH